MIWWSRTLFSHAVFHLVFPICRIIQELLLSQGSKSTSFNPKNGLFMNTWQPKKPVDSGLVNKSKNNYIIDPMMDIS